MAKSSFASIVSLDGYSGRSSRLKHVCPSGSDSVGLLHLQTIRRREEDRRDQCSERERDRKRAGERYAVDLGEISSMSQTVLMLWSNSPGFAGFHCCRQTYLKMENLQGPAVPSRAENPDAGMRDVPVTNCTSCDLRSLSMPSIISQNHTIWADSLQPVCETRGMQVRNFDRRIGKKRSGGSTTGRLIHRERHDNISILS